MFSKENRFAFMDFLLTKISNFDSDQWMWIGFLAGFLFGVLVVLGAIL